MPVKCLSLDPGVETTRPHYRVEAARRILAVDDDRTALMFLEAELRALGYEVTTAVDGLAALDILQQDPGAADVIVLDKIMPRLDGLSVVRRLKSEADLRHIPVVMLTGDSAQEEISEGVDVGVFYYLTKPFKTSILKSVLSSALRDAAQKRALLSDLRTHREGFGMLDTGRFRYRTIRQAHDLATFMACCFPDPERVLPGLAELLTNAIEHGNLEIGYQVKSALLQEGAWQEEIDRRLEMPEYRERSAQAVFTRKENGYYAVITDEGPGFEWRSFLNVDPSRASHSHGRGIAQARTMSFDKVAFNDAGNQVVAFVAAESDLDW